MPDELTPAQTLQIGGPALFGGTGLGGYGPVYRTPAGQTILPAAAAQHGSGAFEGRNAYEHVALGNGLGQAAHLWPGNYLTYRRMRADPTLAVVRSTVIGPIVAAGWTVQAVRRKAPRGAKQLVEDVIVPQRIRLLLSLLRALDYGFQAAEVVWGSDARGWSVPTKVKGLLPDFTTFRVDPKGNLIAVVNQGIDVPMGRALVYTYDGEGDDPYGRSRNENSRRAWSNYLATEDQLFRLGQKTSGILASVGYPNDTKRLKPGELTQAARAANIARALMNGQCLTYPVHGSLEVDDPKDAIELSKGSFFPITLHDMGNTGPAQSALIETLRYYDQIKCRSWLRSERSVIEATGGGTRAESADHTANISDTDCDLIHEDIVDAINRQVVDPLLVENFGERARGTVKLKANEIVDENQVIDRKILDGFINDSVTFGELLSRMDLDGWCERQGIKLREDAKPWDEEMPTGATTGAAGNEQDDDAEDDERP